MDRRNLGWNDIDKFRFYTLQPLFTFSVRLVTFPASLVKTRLQANFTSTTSQEVAYKNTWDAFKCIVRNEGFTALYKGFRVSLLTLGVSPVYFTTLEWTKTRLYSSMNHSTESRYINASLVPAIAGGASSVVAQFIVVPIDIISQKQMIERSNRTNTWNVLRNVVKVEGLLGLYRGFAVSLFTYAPFSAISWGLYDVLKLHAYQGLASNGLQGDSVQLHIGVAAMAACCSATVTTILSNPLDVLRTRMQLEQSVQRSFRQVYCNLIHKHGYRGLMYGASARILAVVPQTMLGLSAYELLKMASMKDS